MSTVNKKNHQGASCAIVVTYHPEMGALLKLLSQLNKETDFLVIDNGSTEAAKFETSIRAYQRCLDYRQLSENAGLAGALNIGLETVRQLGYRFALLFDQDSSLCDLYVESMLLAYQEASSLSDRPVAALGPRIINPVTRRQAQFKLFNRLIYRSDRPFHGSVRLFQADFLITSGTLLALSSLDDIGMMKDSYFIDNVDLEWCFRAHSKGYELVGTDRAVLYHAIGERSTSPLVRRGMMVLHTPERTYYSSRNRVHLYSMSYSPWGWKLRDCVRFFIKASWLLLASKQRKLYWQNITAGIRDARTLG